MNFQLCAIIFQVLLVIELISARPTSAPINSWHPSQRVTRDALVFVIDQSGPQSKTESDLRDGVAEPGFFLELEGPPPKQLSVQLHSDVVIECGAVGIPSPKIHWLKNGIILESQEPLNHEKKSSFVFVMSTIQSKLRLQCTIPEDEAEYTCVAHNGHGIIIATTQIVIEEDYESEEIRPECEYKLSTFFPESGNPAYISSIATMHMANSGSDVILPCQAGGHPQPKLAWFDNNDRPILPSNKRFQINSKGQLLIQDLRGNMGEFYCLVENSFGIDLASTFVYPLQINI